jgi:seryl-tRNA synthetase
MKKCSIPIDGLDEKLIQQLKYAVFFIDETISDITEANGFLVIEHDGDSSAIQNKAVRLIDRFSSHEFAYKEKVLFENPILVPYSGDIVHELRHQRIIKLLENGIFTFRQPFATLLRFFDRCFVSKIGNPLKAEEEYYPVIIHGDTLNKTNHFTSFPEHVHFVSHLKEDLDILDSFSQSMKEQGGWKQEHPMDMNTSLQSPSYMINPATCFHCYEGMQEEVLEEGRVVTAISKVHRYEGKNHRDFGRLMDFTMREIIFVGTPAFVKEKRESSLQMLMDILREYELDCYIENANDPFFTNDYKIKASFL